MSGPGTGGESVFRPTFSQRPCPRITFLPLSFSIMKSKDRSSGGRTKSDPPTRAESTQPTEELPITDDSDPRESFSRVGLRQSASVKSLLRLGVKWFDVGHGMLVQGQADADHHVVTEMSGPHPTIEPGDRTRLSASVFLGTVAQNAPAGVLPQGDAGGVEGWPSAGCHLATPVVVDGDLYGAVCFVGDEPREKQFASDDFIFLDLLAQAVERALLRSRQSDVLDETRAQLEKAETLLKQVQDVAGVAAWELDLEAKQSSWTEKIYDVTGLAKQDELSLRSLLGVVPDSGREEIQTALSQCVREQKPFRVEVPLRSGGGESRWVEVHAAPHVVDGSVRRVIGTFRDATERRRRVEELQRAQRESISRLARAAEYRDFETGAHIRRVGVLARELADELGQPGVWQERIREAAPLHDVGKIGISDSILLKTGPLTEEEYEVMKAHPTIGAQLLSGGGSELLQMAEKIARSHHERWDGKGYPDGLAGEDIPLAARIVSVVDAFDAMTNDRPYRSALSEQEALDAIRAGRGTQFCPRVANAFIRRQERHSEYAP